MINQYVANERFIFNTRTRVNADASAAATTITVKNTTDYSADDYILVGYDGSDTAEVRQINAVTNKTTLDLTGSPLDFAHDRFEYVTKVEYNQRKLYSCATEDGTYTLVNTFDLGVNDPKGTLVTDTGTDTYYKITYYNSETTAETAITDSEVIRSETTEDKVVDGDNRYCTLSEIAKISGFRNASTEDLESVRYRAESRVQSSLAVVYELPLSYIPYMIRRVTAELAAGYLLINEAGDTADALYSRGQALIKGAYSVLKDIKSKSLVLFDADGESLDQVTTQTIDFSPSTSTSENEGYRFTTNEVTQPR